MIDRNVNSAKFGFTMNDDHAGPSENFETTVWTQIREARHDERALQAVLVRYWRPIYAYLRRSGRSQDDAADFTQAFICDRLVTRQLLERAEEGKGRFRNYLLKSLKHFLVDEGRRSSRERSVSLDGLDGDPAALARAEPSPDDDPELAFDRQWAWTVFERALRRLEEDCLEHGQALHWRAFAAAHPGIFAPGVADRSGNDEIAQRIGARDASHVSMLLNTVRRKFKRILRDAIAATLGDDDVVEEEIAYLRRLMR